MVKAFRGQGGRAVSILDPRSPEFGFNVLDWIFRIANLSALPPCTYPRVARRRCHTARGLPPPVGRLDPTGVAARPAAIRGLLL
jgi:hypothetical protein